MMSIFSLSHFDTDGNGFIDRNELKEALVEDLGLDDAGLIDDIMHEVDTDKDDLISYEEFASMMQAGTDWRKASRHYSRERLNSLSIKLLKDGSLQMQEVTQKK
ncbi:hypothetical protein L7F22_024083 [Adiantum nelumboides]|nr:hypothetical protein [Adiantum nelumboides]